MGRVGASSATTVNNEKPNQNQVQEHSHESTQPFVDVFEPQQQQPEALPTQQQPQIYINIQPQFHVPQPQPNYVQQPVSHFQTQNFQPPQLYEQPQPQPPRQQPVMCPPQRQGWTSELFDCVDDPENAIITLFCPCVTFGQIAATIDNGGTSCETAGCIYTSILLLIAFPCIYSFTYRTKLRGRFGLDEHPTSDCLTHLCCEYCALCQEYRELNNRGFNPSAGWMNQNVNQQHAMVPPGYQTMK